MYTCMRGREPLGHACKRVCREVTCMYVCVCSCKDIMRVYVFICTCVCMHIHTPARTHNLSAFLSLSLSLSLSRARARTHTLTRKHTYAHTHVNIRFPPQPTSITAYVNTLVIICIYKNKSINNTQHATKTHHDAYFAQHISIDKIDRRTCDVTHSHVCHDSFAHAYHDSFTCMI